MMVMVTRWVDGAWGDYPSEVVKLTKLHVVVRLGSGTQKFNRRTGRIVGGHTGRAAIMNSHLTQETIMALAKCIEVAS